jgi:GDP-D-mannose 3',5'-epimerase
MKRVLVLGSAGFLGNHLVDRLKRDGCWVRAVDRLPVSHTLAPADDVVSTDLRFVRPNDVLFEDFEECYQLAAEVGGVGFVSDPRQDAQVLSNNMQINLNVLQACIQKQIERVFFPSSSLVYPLTSTSMLGGFVEHTVFPALPGSVYGWEKLFAEKLYQAHMEQIEVRIGRIFNAFGPGAPYDGGRESAPAALIRKALLAQNGTELEVWGDGRQERSFIYVEDAIEGMIRLMASDVSTPLNLGARRTISIFELASMIATICGRMLTIKTVEGPIGGRYCAPDITALKRALNWEPVFPLELGLVHTVRWIATQMKIYNPHDTTRLALEA